MCRSLLIGALLLSGMILGNVALNRLNADEPFDRVASQAKADEGVPQRAIYLPKHASANSLATLLSKHFEGEASVSIVAEPNTNAIAIRASSEATFQELLKTLSLIDKPARQIAFQVLLVELNEDALDANKADPKQGVDPRDLTGPAAAIQATLGKWVAAGQVARVRRYSLTGQENQLCSLRLSEIKPIVNGFTIGGPNRTAFPTLIRDEVGASIDLSPRITETRDIVTMISVEDSWHEPAERGLELAKGENDRPLTMQGKAQSRLRSTLTIPDGHAAVVTEWQLDPKSNHAPGILIVTAEIVAANAPRKTETINVPNPFKPEPGPGSRFRSSSPARDPKLPIQPESTGRTAPSPSRSRSDADPKSRQSPKPPAKD